MGLVKPNERAEPAADGDHHVWIVVWPGVQALDATGPHEVFVAANQVLDSLDRPGPRYRLRLVTADPGRDGSGGDPVVVPTESGLRLCADPEPAVRDTDAGSLHSGRSAEPAGQDTEAGPAARGPDTLVLPGGDGVHDACASPATVALVIRLGAAAGRLATVCTGTFLAAAAGLLDGRRVATHWARAARLAADHPSLTVDPDAIHVCDGPVWSSAGVTAGIDLALALVEHDHDPEVAQIVARWLVVHLRRPGGQSQFASPVWEAPSLVEPVRRAQEAVHADPGGDHSVAALADRVGLSARHFSRLFAAEVGESPARFVERVRVERARHRLESSDAGVDAVARSCGFGTTETLRRSFHRRLGVSPDEYRRRFALVAP